MAEDKQKLSEFEAANLLELYLKDGVPSGNFDGAKPAFVKKGEAIPKVFIPLLLRSNRNYIANLPYDSGIPKLTKEQEEEYGIAFTVVKKERKVVKDKYSQESLNVKLAELGDDKFKDYAEEICGAKIIDRRKSVKSIIVKMLKIQEVGRR